MEIFIYSGFSDLPSIDFDCLRIITFIKLNEIPVAINTTGNPGRSPNGFLPYLALEDKRLIAGYDDIITHFNTAGYGFPSESEDYLSSSYIEYFYKNLYPCFQYILWGDPVNGDATRTLYAKRVPFPFNFTHPAKYTKHTEELLEIYGNFSIKDKVVNHNSAELLINAKVCINMIASKLNENDWLLNNKPAEVDCTLFAYLSILQHISLTNNDLKSHINECPNLLKYIKTINTKYLTDIKVPEKRPSAFDGIKRLVINEEDGSLSRTSLKIIAGLVAVGAMALFAITHGMLEISLDRDEDGSYLAYDDDTSGFDDENED